MTISGSFLLNRERVQKRAREAAKDIWQEEKEQKEELEKNPFRNQLKQRKKRIKLAANLANLEGVLPPDPPDGRRRPPGSSETPSTASNLETSLDLDQGRVRAGRRNEVRPPHRREDRTGQENISPRITSAKPRLPHPDDHLIGED